MTAQSVVKDRSGRVKLTLLIWLTLIVGLVYCGIEAGGVYFRKFQLQDMVAQELSFAGQRSDESIRQRVLDDILGLGLPPAAARGFEFGRTGRPRALEVSISYTETANLIFTQQPIRVSIRARRTF